MASLLQTSPCSQVPPPLPLPPFPLPPPLSPPPPFPSPPPSHCLHAQSVGGKAHTRTPLHGAWPRLWVQACLELCLGSTWPYIARGAAACCPAWPELADYTMAAREARAGVQQCMRGASPQRTALILPWEATTQPRYCMQWGREVTFPGVRHKFHMQGAGTATRVLAYIVLLHKEEWCIKSARRLHAWGQGTV